MLSLVDIQQAIVYGLSCVCHPESGIRYIGKTTQRGKRRFQAHRQNAARGMILPVYNWMRAHGVENIIWVPLSLHGGADSLNRAEVAAIERHRTHVSTGGLNVTFGGDGGTGFKHTTETRMRMSERLKGKKQDPALVAKRVASIRASGGYAYDAERVEKMRAALTGRKLSEAHKAKLSASRTGTANGLAKLDEEKVRDIRGRIAAGEKQRDIATLYGVSQGNITSIKKGRSWGWVI